MQRLKRADALLARGESWLLIASLAGILLIGLAQIILRRFGLGLTWGDEVMRNLTLWVGFIGASIATQEGRHLNIDVLTRFLGSTAKRVSGLVINLVASGVAVVLCYSGAKMLASSITRFQAGDPAVVMVSGMPLAIWQALIPAAFGIIALRFVLKAAQTAFEWKTGNEVVEIASEGTHPGAGGPQ